MPGNISTSKHRPSVQSRVPVRSSNRLLWSAAVTFVSVFGLSLVAVSSYVSVNSSVDPALEIQAGATDWLGTLIDAETGARGYIISGDPVFLEPYASALRKERGQAAKLQRLLADNSSQLRNINEADGLSRAVLERLSEYVGLVGAGRRQDALERLTTGESKNQMDGFRERIARIRTGEARALEARRVATRRRAYGMLAGAVVLSLTSLAILGYAWSLQRTRERFHARLAKQAGARLNSLSDIAAALAETRSRSDVVNVIVEEGLRALQADTCTLYLRDAATGEYVSFRESGVSGATNPRKIRGDETIWAENERECAGLFGASSKESGSRIQAFWSVPLVVEARNAGVLGMGFLEPRKFSGEDRLLVETLARQSGQALLRAVRLESEDEARRWLTTTLRSIGDAVISTDGRGRITFMNPVAESLTDWSEDEARGHSLEDVFFIFSEESRLPVESPVTTVIREGGMVGSNHTVLRSKRGIERPITDSAAPIRDEAGNISGVVLVFRDASEEIRNAMRGEFLARATDALISSLDYQTTLQAVARLAVPSLADWCAVDLIQTGTSVAQHAAVAHADPKKVEFVQHLWERYPPDPAARTGSPEVIRTGKAELYASIPQDLLEGAARDPEHLRLIRSLGLRSAIIVPLQGRERTLGAVSFVYAESERTYTRADLAFAEDFARRAALAIENAMALKEAEEARVRESSLRTEAESIGRAKDEFLAIVSHELRTPLNAILGWAVLLRDPKKAQDTDRGLGIIERNARTQATLIDDVLDVSRTISGKLTLNIVPSDLADIVSAAIDTILPAATAKGIEVSREMPEGAIAISADPDRIQQVVWNLLANAVKFTPKGGVVSVKVSSEDSDVCVSVADSGEGISPSMLPSLFEPFRQADASTTRRHGGLGLGLAIVKQLVTAHGGVVEGQSRGQGTGSTFTVKLPAKFVRATSSLADRAPAVRATAPELGKAVVSLEDVRVLILDNEEDALALVSEVLRMHGAEVSAATSVREALAQFEACLPDVIVSDIGMPHEDGYSFIRKIRALPPIMGGNIPAIALTAYAAASDARLATEAGFQMHVGKPIEPAQLVALIAHLSGGRPESSSSA